MSFLDNVPAAVISPVLALVNGIIRLVQAKNDDERIEALMKSAEDAKAEADKIKFG